MIYTEEMKQAIESHGMMVIEFKKKVRDGVIILTQVANKIVAIVNIFVNTWNDLCHALVEKLGNSIEFFRPLSDSEFYLPHWKMNSEKFSFVKKIDNGYSLFIKRPVRVHCRNTC